MEAIKLMTDAYRLLLEAAASLRASKLGEGEHFQRLLRAAEELASSLTAMMILGVIDPATAKDVEEALRRAYLGEGVKGEG